MKRPGHLVRALALLLLIVSGAHAEDRTSSDRKALFNAEAYLAHVRYLASDELAGRLPGTDGGLAASEYIAEQFEKLGLKPAGVNGTFFQPFAVRRLKNLDEEQAEFKLVGLDHEWKIRRDWMPMPFSKRGKIEGPLAFAGYGVEAPAHGYNDYADFDADGKVLLILRYEPKAEEPDADFGGDPPSRHALFSQKAKVAAKRGAQALLIVNPPNRDPETDELYPWQSWNTHQSYALPLVHISRELANAILERAGMPDLKTLQEKLDSERKSRSCDLMDVTVEIETGIEYVQGRNVAALLEGSGGTDEIIVIGAHYDHLGRVPPQSGGKPQIHNGADDNASGTAGVLEMARAFAAGPRPRRNILFVTFDAEELGLLGSKQFVRHPTIDLERVRAMINFDMIGRVKQDRLRIFGVGSGKGFDALVRSAADDVDLEYEAPRGRAGVFGGSDHFPFYRRDIPILFAFTGIHKQYHQPEDDWELIDGQGAARLLQMMYTVVNDVANMESGPTFVSAAEQEEEPTTRPADDEEDEARERRARGRPAVRLGIMPDLASEEGGLGVDAVIAGGPAEKAGMKDGDRIIRIGDYTISDIYSYMDALRDLKPGDEVEVVVERAGKKITLKIKLGATPRRPEPEGD